MSAVHRIPNPAFWRSIGAVLRTPEDWHSFDWRSNVRYRELVEWAAELVLPGTPVYWQAEPCLRVQRPGTTCVPWHTDAEFGHQPEEWTVHVPLTWITHDSQRVWLTDGRTGAAYAPPTQLDYALVFPGAIVAHGNVPNQTRHERRSMDFRIIARDELRDTGAKTVVHGVPLALGAYWRE